MPAILSEPSGRLKPVMGYLLARGFCYTPSNRSLDTLKQNLEYTGVEDVLTTKSMSNLASETVWH